MKKSIGHRVLWISVAHMVSACLTVDDVTTRDPGVSDAGAPDAGESGGDGAAHAPPPCEQRGVFEIDGVTLIGPATCAGASVCIEDACVPEPACEEGMTGPCQLSFASTYGSITSSVIGYADYLYWVEGGTFDELQNYRNDGAVVRVKAGVWEREEILTGLDLYTTALRGGLGEANGWFHVWNGSSDEWFSPDASQRYASPSVAGLCVSPDGKVYGPRDQHGGYEYDLRTDTTRAVPGFGREAMERCIHDGSRLWFTKNSGQLMSWDLVSPEVVAHDLKVAGLVAVQDETVYAIQGPTFLVSATPLAEGPHAWTNRAGGVQNSMGSYEIRGNDVYWARWDTERSGALLVRSSLLSPGTPVVVSEMWDLGRSRSSGGSFTVAGEVVAWRGGESETIHVAPIR